VKERLVVEPDSGQLNEVEDVIRRNLWKELQPYIPIGRMDNGSGSFHPLDLVLIKCLMPNHAEGLTQCSVVICRQKKQKNR
jgi:hypothetical protein